MRDADSMTAAVCSLPRGVMRRQLARISAHVRRRTLDAELAEGVSPWSTPALMVRASRLTSLPDRRRLAAGLVAVVALSESDRSAVPTQPVRHRVVWEQRDALLVLADRLAQPAPVEVAVVAQLALLLSDESSPIYVGGSPARGLAAVTSRCLDAVA
jgi:hypothetical protein